MDDNERRLPTNWSRSKTCASTAAMAKTRHLRIIEQICTGAPNLRRPKFGKQSERAHPRSWPSSAPPSMRPPQINQI
ncbi:hypothetical protein [Sphingomonas sp. T9W2]|uniref:hypothetical protein n=1 Tax=Sphingomonas sp. T9W2 TaxID=3143183 RepID=UPI0031F5566D